MSEYSQAKLDEFDKKTKELEGSKIHRLKSSFSNLFSRPEVKGGGVSSPATGSSKSQEKAKTSSGRGR